MCCILFYHIFKQRKKKKIRQLQKFLEFMLIVLLDFITTIFMFPQGFLTNKKVFFFYILYDMIT